MKKVISEFKIFISRGNVIDMAVGIIIGSAFTAIVTSLVQGLLMPLLGLLTGGINFSSLKIILREATELQPELAIMYGDFIQQIISFLLIAAAVFALVKIINAFKEMAENKEKEEKEEEKPEPPSEPSDELKALYEIRDALKDIKRD